MKTLRSSKVPWTARDLQRLSAAWRYPAVLKDAQRLGYAEADPAADVEGWDARSKLCILAKLGFGITLDATAPEGTRRC